MSELDFSNAPHARQPREFVYRQAAGIVVVDPRGKILIGECWGFPNIWKMPSGGIEKGETPWVAARRELLEETGFERVVHIETSTQLHTFEYPPEHKRYKRGIKGQTTHWFHGETIQMTLAMLAEAARHPPKSREFRQLRWANPQEVLSLTHNGTTGDVISSQTQKIYAAVLTEFGLLPAPAPQQAQRRLPRGTRPAPTR